MKIIGLCGGSGSGKSLATKSFSARGIPILNTDDLYHSLIESDSECSRALISAFGQGIGNSKGGIDRKALSAIVFGQDSENYLNKLNEIAHFYVLSECRKLISLQEKNGALAVIVDAPMLFESGFDKECDIVVAVIADRDTRKKRIIKRDNLTELQAESRIKNQADEEFLAKKSDFIIYNDKSEKDLDLQVEKICGLILG